MEEEEEDPCFGGVCLVICPGQRDRNLFLSASLLSECDALCCGRRSWGERTLPSRMAGAVGLAGEDAPGDGGRSRGEKRMCGASCWRRDDDDGGRARRADRGI